MHNLNTRQFLRYARRQARSCFLGMVTEQKDEVIGGESVTVNTVRKFNRRALLSSPVKKESAPVGDLSLIRVGRPGSKDRLDAYRAFHEKNQCSVFMEEKEE